LTPTLLLPDLPRTIAAPVHAIEGDLVLIRIHRLPEPVVSVRGQQTLLPKSGKRLFHQLFAFDDVIEDLPAECEKAAVDGEVVVAHRPHGGDEAVWIALHRVKTVPGTHRGEARHDLFAAKILDHR